MPYNSMHEMYDWILLWRVLDQEERNIKLGSTICGIVVVGGIVALITSAVISVVVK
jgi:hypothetical protein